MSEIQNLTHAMRELARGLVTLAESMDNNEQAAEALAQKNFASKLTRITVHELTIDQESRRVTLGDEQIELNSKMYDLLCYLASEPKRVYTKQELLRDVWGYELMGSTRTLDSHASRLRRKLQPSGSRRWIVNVWGVGYRLVDSL